METIYHHKDTDDWSDFSADYEEAVDAYLAANFDVPEDGVIVIYQGSKKAPNVKGFVSDILDSMAENANFGIEGEYAGGWPQLSDDKERSFQAHMERSIEQWFKNNNENPNWFSVVNVSPIRVKLSGYDPVEGSYCALEVLTAEQDAA